MRREEIRYTRRSLGLSRLIRRRRLISGCTLLMRTMTGRNMFLCSRRSIRSSCSASHIARTSRSIFLRLCVIFVSTHLSQILAAGKDITEVLRCLTRTFHHRARQQVGWFSHTSYLRQNNRTQHSAQCHPAGTSGCHDDCGGCELTCFHRHPPLAAPTTFTSWTRSANSKDCWKMAA